MARKLILVALIALVVCTGFGFKASCTAPATEWRLTISSTEGGLVTSPGEGMFWYDDGDVVSLRAIPAPGYQFVGWTGRVDTIGSPWMAATRIAMTLDYTIVANFAPLPQGEPGGCQVP
jgi:hypothetical protein